MSQALVSKQTAHGSAWLSMGVFGMALVTVTWQHATLGMPILSEETRQVLRIEDVKRAPIAAAHTVEFLPSRVMLDVPFSAQAPFGDWSSPYNEACEETSVAMAIAWARGEALTPARAREEILRLVDFEQYHFGYHEDTAIRETAKLITRHYRHEGVSVLYDIGRDDIRRALADGNIVIVPVAGAALPNPYFIVPPPYHMLVVIGYDDDAQEFITNDPGTRNGEGLRYAYDVLEQAIHDWTGSDEAIFSGRRGMIIVGK